MVTHFYFLFFLALNVLNVVKIVATNVDFTEFHKSSKVHLASAYTMAGKPGGVLSCAILCHRLTDPCVSFGVTLEGECLTLVSDDNICVQNTTGCVVQLVFCNAHLPTPILTLVAPTGIQPTYFMNVKFLEVPFNPEKFQWKVDGWPDFSLVGRLDMLPKYGETINITSLSDGCCYGMNGECNRTPWPCVKNMDKCGRGYCNCTAHSTPRTNACVCSHLKGGVLNCTEI